MKKIVKRIVASTMMALTMLCCISFGGTKAEAVSYEEVQRFEDQEVIVKTSSNYYFDKMKLTSTKYVADCIPVGTEIGRANYTIVTSQTTTSNKGTVLGSINFGKTWGDAVNVGITMKPKDSISAVQYIGEGYNMSNASVWGAGSTFKYYVASEDLKNRITFNAPNKSYGYLSNWSPNYNQDTEGCDKFTFGLTISNSGASFTAGTTLSITDSFVDAYDNSEQDTGRYNVGYNYKKYNSVGFCSSDRRAKVFGNTTVYDSLEYRAVKSSLGLSRYVYVIPTFTVVDSKSWPTEIKGFSETGKTKITF